MSFLTRLFGRERQPRQARMLSVTSTSNGSVSAFNADPWESPDYRAGVDFIGRQCGKLRLQPVRTWSDGTTSPCDERLAHILQERWNPLMTSFDGIYQAVVHMLVTGNAFIFIERQGNRPVALWPLHVAQSKFVTTDEGGVWVALRFQNGRSAVLAMDDLLILRRHFNKSDVVGDPNTAISTDLQMADALSREIRTSCRNSGAIRGIVSYSGMNSDERLAKLRDEFVRKNFSDNGTGIIFTDQSMNYQPLEAAFAPVSSSDLQAVRDRLLASLGVNAALIDGSFTADQYASFLESVLEPLSLQLCQELDKVCVPGESIVADMSRLRYLSGDVAVRLVKEGMPTGLLTIDEGRQILGLPPLPEGGDQRLQSLNFVSAADALKYQLFKATNGSGVKAIEEEGSTE